MHAFLLETNEFKKEFLDETYKRSVVNEIKKIEDVRNLQSLLKFPPHEKTAFVITGLSEASTEAQNALLKIFEEPPSESTYFFLIVPNKNVIIPTILSRVHIQKVNKENDNKRNLEVTTENKGDLLKLTSGIKTREDATLYLKNIIDNKSENIRVREGAMNAYTALSQNANVNLTLLKFIVTL